MLLEGLVADGEGAMLWLFALEMPDVLELGVKIGMKTLEEPRVGGDTAFLIASNTRLSLKAFDECASTCSDKPERSWEPKVGVK